MACPLSRVSCDRPPGFWLILELVSGRAAVCIHGFRLACADPPYGSPSADKRFSTPSNQSQPANYKPPVRREENSGKRPCSPLQWLSISCVVLYSVAAQQAVPRRLLQRPWAAFPAKYQEVVGSCGQCGWDPTASEANFTSQAPFAANAVNVRSILLRMPPGD